MTPIALFLFGELKGLDPVHTRRIGRRPIRLIYQGTPHVRDRIALAILGAVCLHAAIGTHRAGCERRDSYALAGLGIVAGSGGALLLV